MAWRAADSCALREFLGLVLPEAPPDHSTISRTRRLIDLETHEAVFTWMLQRLADAGLVKGTTVGIDATTLEANAALRSIVRRDTGESYQDFLTKLAQARYTSPIAPRPSKLTMRYREAKMRPGANRASSNGSSRRPIERSAGVGVGSVGLIVRSDCKCEAAADLSLERAALLPLARLAQRDIDSVLSEPDFAV